MADETTATHLHLDVLGGAAGDMILAALLDLRPDLETDAVALARSLGPGLNMLREVGEDGGLRGSRVRLSLPTSGHGPHHYPEYVNLLAEAAPDDGTRARALDILRRLGEAEAHVHGVPLERVHFHEIADWDSVADILLNAWTLERLDVRSASVSALPLGSGRVQTEHGPMPVPAPATLELMRGLTVIDDGIPGERITPTGAAILGHLAPASMLPEGPLRLSATGYGFGHRRLPGIANAIRASLWHGAPARGERIGVLRFAIDDQTGEDLAIGLERLRAAEGVVDVLQSPAFGKKGRMTVRVEVLCASERLNELARLCLAETSTIGVRLAEERRLVLPRTLSEADGVRIKQVTRPDQTITHKAEMDDVAHAGDRAAREKLRRDVEASDRSPSSRE